MGAEHTLAAFPLPACMQVQSTRRQSRAATSASWDPAVRNRNEWCQLSVLSGNAIIFISCRQKARCAVVGKEEMQEGESGGERWGDLDGVGEEEGLLHLHLLQRAAAHARNADASAPKGPHCLHHCCRLNELLRPANSLCLHVWIPGVPSLITEPQGEGEVLTEERTKQWWGPEELNVVVLGRKTIGERRRQACHEHDGYLTSTRSSCADAPAVAGNSHMRI